MSTDRPPLFETQRRRIRLLWDNGHDSAVIAARMHVPEHLVVPVISAHVTAKKFRKSAF